MFEALRSHKVPLSAELERAAEGTGAPGPEEAS
jgi:hypothetical protein